MGGLYVRAFARKFPEAVAGLVLIDGTHEDQWDYEPRRYWEPTTFQAIRLKQPEVARPLAVASVLKEMWASDRWKARRACGARGDKDHDCGGPERTEATGSRSARGALGGRRNRLDGERANRRAQMAAVAARDGGIFSLGQVEAGARSQSLYPSLSANGCSGCDTRSSSAHPQRQCDTGAGSQIVTMTRTVLSYPWAPAQKPGSSPLPPPKVRGLQISQIVVCSQLPDCRQS